MFEKLIISENPNYFSFITTILYLPCGEVTTVMRALVCPGEVFTFHHCELFEAVIHCLHGGVVMRHQLPLWQWGLQLHEHLNGCFSEKLYKAKVSSRTHISLVGMALKRC